jgi:uncharacterized protein (DUF952 family)
VAARVYHIASRSAWDDAVAAGRYAPASLSSEGFIHLSYGRQLGATLERFFAGQDDLVVLVIDPGGLGDALREADADGDRFPHLHAALALDPVVEVVALAAEPAARAEQLARLA